MRSVKSWKTCVVLAVSAWVSLTAPVTAIAQRYIVADLGTLPGAGNSQAFGINDSGQVVGSSGGHAFIWDGSSGMQDIGDLGGGFADAFGISGNGKVTGQAQLGGPCCSFDAFLWTNGVIQDLGKLGGSGSRGFGVNSNGQVVGRSSVSFDPFVNRAFLWSGGVMSDLGTLGGSNSSAIAINDAGQVVGYAEPSRSPGNETDHAFLWQSGSMTDLGDLGGDFSIANGINSVGQVVGAANTAGGAGHAFLWDSGVMYDLGTANSFNASEALAINNRGQVVGYLGNSFPGIHAFLYDQGVMTDLNDLISTNAGWVLWKAHGINDAGQIAGWGVHNGQFRAFVLSPVKLEDAQAFGPTLNDGVPTLSAPITNAVDSSFDRIGSLTDGASLVVVQIGTPGLDMAGWTVSLTDPDNTTNGPAALGSLWHGDNTSLPPLPVTTNDLGSATLTLGTSEAAIFYRAAPSWAFGTSNKTHDIQIQIFDQNANLVVASPFTLHKPPLVLVHGWTGNPGNWDDFPSVLAGAGIEVDTFRADYAVSNTCGIDAVFEVVPKAISNRVVNFRANMKVAATRVDVVAHSYGGVLTRWYMTPSSQLPDGENRAVGASPAPLFKTTTIKGTRSADLEFVRADNFGIGDIRRFITLGVPHTGTSAAWKAIQILNQWVTGKRYRNREIRSDVMSLEKTLSTTNQDFRAIGLNEAGTPTEFGMSIIDAAAFGVHPVTGTCVSCPDVSLALASLPAIPVEYLPIEGTALGNNVFWNALVWVGQRAFLHGVPPADIKPGVSDGFIPALSVRNRTARRDDYNLTGVNHSQLTSAPALGPILEQALGADDSIFLKP